MQPDLETFAKAVKQYRGNLSKVAQAFGVTRTTVGLWQNTNDEWKQVVRDARMRLFDDCLIAGELLATGIPIKDDDGKFIGWEKAPDGQMIRYFLSCLGQQEGFSDTAETATDKTIESVGPKKIEVSVVYNSKEDLELQTKAAEVAMETKAAE